MWLWYLELYLLTLIAFALGAGVGLLAVRFAVHRRADDPTLGAPVAPATDHTAASATPGKAEAGA